jgi:hypothetical protein
MDHLWGILWTQTLLFLAVALPLASIAAMTREIHGYALGVLAGAGLVALVQAHPTGEQLGWILELDWTRHSVLVALAVPAALAVLGLQYGSGRTKAARGLAIAVAVAALTLSSFMPVSFAMAMQSLFSGAGEADPDSVMLELDSSARGGWERILREGEVGIELPITISMADPSVDFDLYRVTATLEGRDGARIATILDTDPEGGPGETAERRLRSRLPRGAYDLHRSQPVRLRVSVDLALWEHARTYRSDPLPSFRVDSLYCALTKETPRDLEVLTCRSPLGRPSGWILTDFQGGRLKPFQGSMATFGEARHANYSPLPAALDMNAVEVETFGREPSDETRAIRFVLSEPVAYLTKELETTIHLSDYVVE